MGKSKAPRPADPRDTAAAQTSTNIATAIAQQNLGNINQITPYGNLTYNKTGEYEYVDPIKGETYIIPRYTAEQTLSEKQQEILNHNNEAGVNLSQLASEQSASLRDLFRNSFNPMATKLPEVPNIDDLKDLEFQTLGDGPNLATQIAGLNDVQSTIHDAGIVQDSYDNDFLQDRTRVEEALLERLNPQLDRDKRKLEVKLANQGIRLGSDAYRRAISNFDMKQNDARLGAIISAGQEHSRLANLSAQKAQFANQAQAQRFNQASTAAQFGNRAQAQEFSQALGQANFGNNAKQLEYQNHGRKVDSNNQRNLQLYKDQLSKFDAKNALRSQELSEKFSIRNQPINEITALLSGSQIENPNFINPYVSKIANTDFIGAQNNYDKAMQDRHKQNASGVSGGIESLIGIAKLFA